MAATDGGDEKKPPPPKVEKKPSKVTLYAECMGWHADLGGIRYSKREIVELKGALEAEARANPAGWRIFTKEG